MRWTFFVALDSHAGRSDAANSLGTAPDRREACFLFFPQSSNTEDGTGGHGAPAIECR
jgi:hypothetical protein